MQKPKVKLVEEDGNAYTILSTVRKALIKVGKKEEAQQYMIEVLRFLEAKEEVTDKDYTHLLQITTKYVEVE